MCAFVLPALPHPRDRGRAQVTAARPATLAAGPAEPETARLGAGGRGRA